MPSITNWTRISRCGTLGVTELRPALFPLDMAQAGGGEHARAYGFVVRELPGRSFSLPRIPGFGRSEEQQAASSARQNVPFLLDPRSIPGNSSALARCASAGLVPTRPADCRTSGADVGAPWSVRRVDARRDWIDSDDSQLRSSFTARRALSPVDAIVARARRIQAEKPERATRGGGAQRRTGSAGRDPQRHARSTRGLGATARRFAADASHELQTPLAAMRSVVEAIG